MEAKDTILPYLQVSNQIPMTLLDFIAKLESQAKISFEAGKQEGRREMVGEFPIMYREEAEFVDRLTFRGWIPPEEVRMGRWVKLAENQELPENPYGDPLVPKSIPPGSTYEVIGAYVEAQLDMLKAGFRKIEVEP